MDIIRSWEFDKELLYRNVCLILKIYAKFSEQEFPSVEDIELSVENLNRQILAAEDNLSDEQINDIYEELESQGQFACMWQFIENIIDKQKLSMSIGAENVLGVTDFGEAICVTNDAQNILGVHQIIDDGIIFQGRNVAQILKKQDRLLKLEA